MSLLRAVSLSVLTLMSCKSLASTPKLSCTISTASHVLDTMYVFSETEDGYKLTVQYSPGATPLEADPSTTARVRDLEELNIRAELFSRLPEKFTLNFKKEECRIDANNSQLDWHCFIKQPGKLGEVNYKAISFFVYSQKVESPFGTSYWYNLGIELGLSLEGLLGREKLEELWEKSNAEERSRLNVRRKYETLLRSMVVNFENTETHKTCYVPEHPFKGVLDQL